MLKFGIIGAGVIAHKFAEDINKVAGAKLVAIASRDIKRAVAFKEHYTLDYAFGNYEEMARSNKIDAVYIATPHNFHKNQSIMFMEYHKHVLCEKPIAVNLFELDEMIASAKVNKVLLMEALWTRFLPSSIYMKNLVESNQFGLLKEVVLEFGYALIENYSEEKRLLNPSLAGGSLLDLGVYPISFLMYLNQSKIKSLKAAARLHKTGVDIETRIEILFENGLKAFLKCSMDTNLNAPGKFEFEKGIVLMEDFSRCKKLIVNGESLEIPYIEGGFNYQIASFIKTINNNLLENDIMSYEESRKVMKIMDDVRKMINLKYPFEV